MSEEFSQNQETSIHNCFIHYVYLFLIVLMRSIHTVLESVGICSSVVRFVVEV